MKYLIIMLVGQIIITAPLFVTEAWREFASEIENSAVIADKNGWETEVTVDDGSRCDILNETHAIEVEWATKWKEAPAQAVLYGIFTGKKPKVILLIKDRTKESVYILRCKLVCENLGIEMETVDAL